MFAELADKRPFLRTRGRRRGWLRAVLLVAGLVLASARLAYGSEPARFDTVVVAPGDTVWSIARAHYAGDLRPHVDSIIRSNNLKTPGLVPGQQLRIPVE